jgi:hypothetical protein
MPMHLAGHHATLDPELSTIATLNEADFFHQNANCEINPI